MDVLELALYNAVLSGVSLEGSDYFYVNPLRQVEPLPTELRWSRERVPFVTSYCCPPNVLRTIAEVSGYAYSKTDDAMWVNLYGANKLATTLNGQPLKLTQRTRYPWEGVVGITIDEAPESEFALKLRIPGWAEEATIGVNGSPVKAAIKPGTYAEIRRRWKKGDVVGLHIADAAAADGSQSARGGDPQSSRVQVRADRVLPGVGGFAEGRARAGCASAAGRQSSWHL